MKMQIVIIDPAGKKIGKLKDDILFNLKGNEICKVEPKTKISQIVRILLTHEELLK